MRTEKDFLEYLNTIREIAKEEGYDSLDETYVNHLRCRYFGQDVVIGTTDRFVLREMKMSDLEAFYGFEGASEEEVLKQFLRDRREDATDYLKAYIASMYPLYDHGIWSIEERSGGEILGLCGLGRIEVSGEEVTDLGYYIRPEKRRQGLASEAVRIALEYGKEYIELPEIYARVRKENEASIGLLCKFGFEEVELLEDRIIYRKNLRK